MENIQALRRSQRANGPATILAIGTANPPTLYEQTEFPDYYFRVTNSEDKTELKAKFKRLCEKTKVKRRYMYLNEEVLAKKPTLCTHMEPSLDERQDLLVEAVPELAKEAASKALKEWGRPKSDITHLIFCSMGGIDMPGADYRLVNLLGLPLTVNRIMLYTQACHMGASMLRIAKDIVENNKNARVLVVSCEMTMATFRGPNEKDIQSLAGTATFGDGSGAAIIGADPIPGIEKPIFEIYSAKQLTVPDSERAVGGHLREVGLTFHFLNQLPNLISDNIETCLNEAFKLMNVTNWNDLFWCNHPGTMQIIDAIQAKLGLEPEKLDVARHVLQEYGNVMSACVYFIMDETRKRSATKGKSTTGDGKEWGICFGFGPGLSIETVALRSVPI